MTQSRPPNTAPDEPGTIVQVDIISDVMCPWCVIGFRQLEQALAQTAFGARVRWHPFELNPDMPEGGEPMGEHLARKYGSTAAQAAETSGKIKQIGASLGFAFKMSGKTRIVNSFAAHCLLDWSATHGAQHRLKMALFAAHFSQGRDVSDPGVLADIASECGLDRNEAAAAIKNPAHAKAVRAQEEVWYESGISGVPSMIFAEKILVTGAQDPSVYARALTRAAGLGESRPSPH